MTIIAPHPETPINRPWSTPIAFSSVDLTALGAFEPLLADTATPEPYEALALGDYITREDLLADAFLSTMCQLAARERSDGIEVADPQRVSLSLSVWRAGYELAMYSSSNTYLGWCFLASRFGAHADSGTISILDPRAGAGLTAVPGLPWARHMTIQPRAGFLAVVPGWLTVTVLPFEATQISVLVTAESLPS